MVQTRSQKETQIQEIRDVMEDINSVFLVSLAGLPSNDVNILRANLRKLGASVRVVKNRLAKRAAGDGPIAKLDQFFRGPTALVYHPSDPVAMAKSLVEFAKDHPQLEMRAGLIDRTQVVAGAEAKAVAELPSLDQIRATMLALINTPATMLVRLINTPAGHIARAVSEYNKKREGGEEAAPAN